MEIPYTVTARKDTGLFNSKIGIWLFLASEVMLFGGLFSGYVFLRIYADYPWPERTLPVVPGLINTFVLIGSSVTVVFAWAALKMRQWKRFQLFMGITIVCAVIFMILKGIEYNAKWNHQAIKMDDYTIVEGHTHYAKIDDKGGYKIYHKGGHGDDHGHHEDDAHGGAADGGHGEDKHADAGDGHGDDKHASHESDVFMHKRILFEADEITFSVLRAHDPWVKEIIRQAEVRGSKLVHKPTPAKYTAKGTDEEKRSEISVVGAPLEPTVIKDVRGYYLNARKNNQNVRTESLRRSVADARANNPKLDGWNKKALRESYLVGSREGKVDTEAIKKDLWEVPANLTFKVEPPTTFHFRRKDIKESPEMAQLRDDTVLRGKLKSSPIALAVDAVDFRFVAQRAEERGQDPMEVIDKSWILTQPGFRDIWEKHKEHIAEMEKALEAQYGFADEAKTEPKRVPTDTERYRIGWKEMVGYHTGNKPGLFDGFAGPDHYNKDYKPAFLELSVPNDKVALESMFEPKWNTYYAIYFTITGLHGLHVIGGAIVLGYYLFFSKSLYLKNPEHLANRVEVGGLFWHFVDLVWIFLFPILYLM
mgnify:CR=1 FL=1